MYTEKAIKSEKKIISQRSDIDSAKSELLLQTINIFTLRSGTLAISNVSVLRVITS